MLTYKIHFLRHGLTQANLEGRYIGRTDPPLCPQGRGQLKKLLETHRYPHVQAVWASPLRRAVETAELLYPGREIRMLDGMREFDFGDFENRTISDLEGDPAFRSWTAASSPDERAPGGESARMMTERAVRATAHVFGLMIEQKIHDAAIVTHGGVIASLFAAMGLPARQALLWHCEPGCGFTVLLSAQMWMRDQKFEVYEQIPYPNEEDEQ